MVQHLVPLKLRPSAAGVRTTGIGGNKALAMWTWLAILGVAIVVWRTCQPRGDCTVEIRRGQVAFRGKLPAGRCHQIEQYLLEYFADVSRLRIDLFYPRGTQQLRLKIRGRISPGDRQQIRNFLSTIL